MTREEFIRDIDTWCALKEFCDDYDCDICEDIVDDDSRDDEIDDDIAEEIRYRRWYEIRDYLSDIPTGYSYYRRNGTFDYDGMDDDDLEEYKNDVLEWGDDNGIWDDDEADTDEDEGPFEDEPEDDEPSPEEEDFSVGDLIGMCVVALGTIQNEDARRAREEEEEFRRLYPKILK